jgi:dyslexia susceptibility 1 candidate gene 1 protein
MDIEEKDPVWLKDKGDHFYNRHDFNGAMNAYCKAITADKDFLKAYLNRATTFIKMRRFEHCIEDIDDIVEKVGAV